MSDHRKKKIMFIDDDNVQLVVAQNVLKSEYEIITANSGKKALEVLSSGFSPNLIILDILMPSMDGWEVYKKIKSISVLNDVPIAFLTSLHGVADERHAYEIGAADFIEKPFYRDDLLKRIETIFEKYEK